MVVRLLKAYIDKQIIMELTENYQGKSDADILSHVDKISEEQDKGKKEERFFILRDQLKWKETEPAMERNKTAFSHSIRKLMSK